MKSLETHTLRFYISSITGVNDRLSLGYKHRVLYFILYLLTRERKFHFTQDFQNAMREKLHYLYFCGTIEETRVFRLEEDLCIRARCISGSKRCPNITTQWNSVYCEFHSIVAKINRYQLQGLLHQYMTPRVARISIEYAM